MQLYLLRTTILQVERAGFTWAISFIKTFIHNDLQNFTTVKSHTNQEKEIVQYTKSLEHTHLHIY